MRRTFRPIVTPPRVTTPRVTTPKVTTRVTPKVTTRVTPPRVTPPRVTTPKVTARVTTPGVTTETFDIRFPDIKGLDPSSMDDILEYIQTSLSDNKLRKYIISKAVDDGRPEIAAGIIENFLFNFFEEGDLSPVKWVTNQNLNTRNLVYPAIHDGDFDKLRKLKDVGIRLSEIESFSLGHNISTPDILVWLENDGYDINYDDVVGSNLIDRNLDMLEYMFYERGYTLPRRNEMFRKAIEAGDFSSANWIFSSVKRDMVPYDIFSKIEAKYSN